MLAEQHCAHQVSTQTCRVVLFPGPAHLTSLRQRIAHSNEPGACGSSTAASERSPPPNVPVQYEYLVRPRAKPSSPASGLSQVVLDEAEC